MGGTAEHVQAKSLIDSMLQLIERVWGAGGAQFLRNHPGPDGCPGRVTMRWNTQAEDTSRPAGQTPVQNGSPHIP